MGRCSNSRIANSSDLITGALPAQYGYRTSGVVDIQTKSGAFESGGAVGIYGGSYDRVEPSFEAMGSSGNLNYYGSASFLRDSLGIESPTGDRNTIHDVTNQGKGLFYGSDLLDPSTRLSVIAGTSIGNFQIPNNPGQTPMFTAFGQSNFDSAHLDENQKERNHYAVVALQQSRGAANYQVAYFARYSTVHFTPDVLGDLIFNGVASDVYRQDFANGLEGDGSYKLTDTHTLRAGFFYSAESTLSDTTTTVEPLVGGAPVDAPFAIQDNGHKTGYLYGLYLQDEWRLLPKVTLNYGGRFDLVDAYTHAWQISPRVNLVYTPTDTTTFHLGYARYFTPPPLELIAPTSVSKFDNTTGAAEFTDQSSPVKAERSNYFDVGVVQKVTPALQLGVDAYYKKARHLLDEGQFGSALVFSPFNYELGRIYGVEFTGSYQKGNFRAYGNLGISRAFGKGIESAQFEFGQDELDYIASHYVHLDHDQRYTASVGASYDLDGTLLSVDAIYGSGLRSGFANTGHLPDYGQVNLGVSHDFTTTAFGAMTARFDVINVLDEKYEIRDGSGIGVGAPQFGPRRAFYAGLTKKF